MNNIITKLKNTTSNVNSKLQGVVLATSLACTNLVVSAKTLNQTGVNKNVSATQVVERFITQILEIFQYIGILLAIWGAVQLVMSFKNEDADSKSRSMMVLISAIFLIGIKAVLQGVGILK